MKDQPHFQILDEVFKTGQTYEARQIRADLAVDGKMKTYYFDLVHKPLRNAAGEVYGIMDMSVDVTEQVVARQQLEERERFSRTIFYNSPVAKLVYVGPDMILREANQKMLEIFGRDASILGKPILEAIPELMQTPLIKQYQEVLMTGTIHEEIAQRMELIKNGSSYWGYYDYTYKPLLDTNGQPYGVISTMIDVTQQVLARQKLEEAEAGLRGAIELAQLGTWSIDVATGGLTYSDRLIDWFGYDPSAQDFNQVIPILSAEDQERVAAAVARALRPDSDGIYEETYTLIHPRTGQKRVLHAQGKTVFDASGKAIRLNGTAQDITLQRALQLALEQEVQQRTVELAAANEELAATIEELEASNEEYAAINEELSAAGEEIEQANKVLAETNGHLVRSNQNLEQFAYIASHDLQEPLRKIQQFGDLLKTRYVGSSGEELVYLNRMQVAASRMSLLIKDLLAFSRIATGQAVQAPVALATIVEHVIDTLSIVIGETDAHIQVDALPLVQGDARQLEQLFQNLLSNALKYSRQDQTGKKTKPKIRIRARQVMLADLPASVHPARQAVCYHLLEVTDNGIGFDEKYTSRIFQVFQRLHAKNEFAGTGIGLAICEKVVTNHGGAITATSQPGQGATFRVYLPA